MYDEIGEGVDGKILGDLGIVNISVEKKHKTVKQLLHDAFKGTFVTIQKTAVATCAVIHVGSSFGSTLSLVIRRNKGRFLIKS
jgi:hypothetical protein